MMGLQEDLALERVTLVELRREREDAWALRQYREAVRLAGEIERAKERILELEEREAGA